MKETPVKTLIVATVLCLVCSVFVAVTAISLRPQQQLNIAIDIKKNILTAAGRFDPAQDVDSQFSVFETLIVDLSTGEVLEESQVPGGSIANYDQYKAMKKPEFAVKIPSDIDLGRLNSRAKYSKIYVVREDSAVKEIILPVKSKGLWSTMYGFIALEGDARTVKGFSYYQQGETPGLGAEVENPAWKGQWPGKMVTDDDGKPAIDVIKGKVDLNGKLAKYQIDGLSGATITSDGIENSMRYWFGDHGYQKFLAKVQTGEI